VTVVVRPCVHVVSVVSRNVSDSGCKTLCACGVCCIKECDRQWL
jgi:hypothetical protein